MIVHFHVLSPPAKQRSFTARLPLLLGRGEEAKFRIQHDLVSRRHCEFFARDGRVFIHDLGSTNGTFLDDEPLPVSTKTEVPPGAVVRVGGLSFRVDYQPPQETGTPSPVTAADAVGREPPQSDAEESRVAGPADAVEDDGPDFDFVAPATAETERLEEARDGAGGQEIIPTEPVAAEDPPAGDAALSFSVPDVSPPADGPWAGLDAAGSDAADGDSDDDDSDDGPGDDKLNEFFKGLK